MRNTVTYRVVINSMKAEGSNGCSSQGQTSAYESLGHQHIGCVEAHPVSQRKVQSALVKSEVGIQHHHVHPVLAGVI
jgi:hypothetical protein